MGTHNVFDNNQCPCGPTNDPIVDKLLGNAYQVVKYVAMNMPAIKVVSDEIASILAVYAKLKELSDIQAKIPELMEVQAALPQLEVLHTNLVQLLTLYTHIDELVKVATGIDDIHIITPHLQELASVAANITEVVATGTDITKVIAVANSIASVNKLAPVVAEIDALAQNVQALVNINTHLPELLNINHHLPDLLNIETPLSKLVINSFEALRRTYAEAGLTLVTGSFEDGAKVTTKQDVVLERKTGKGYNWQGAIPSGGKVIPAGSTPASTGGVGPGKWVDVSAITLRELMTAQVRESLRRSYADAGFNLVDGSFELGGVLVNPNDVLLQSTTGKAFTGPAGVVAAGTNPASGGFVDVSDKVAITFPSIAEATVSIIPSGTIVRTGGYYQLGDGGGGTYVVRGAGFPVAVDPARLIHPALPNGSTLELQFTEHLNFLQAGGKADWSRDTLSGTDNTPILQNAIDYLFPFVWKGTVAATNATPKKFRCPIFVPTTSGKYMLGDVVKLNPFTSIIGPQTGRGFGMSLSSSEPVGAFFVPNFSSGKATKYVFDAAPYNSSGVRVSGASLLLTNSDKDNGIYTPVDAVTIENVLVCPDFSTHNEPLGDIHFSPIRLFGSSHKIKNNYFGQTLHGPVFEACWDYDYDGNLVQTFDSAIAIYQGTVGNVGGINYCNKIGNRVRYGKVLPMWWPAIDGATFVADDYDVPSSIVIKDVSSGRVSFGTWIQEKYNRTLLGDNSSLYMSMVHSESIDKTLLAIKGCNLEIRAGKTFLPSNRLYKPIGRFGGGSKATFRQMDFGCTGPLASYIENGVEINLLKGCVATDAADGTKNQGIVQTTTYTTRSDAQNSPSVYYEAFDCRSQREIFVNVLGSGLRGDTYYGYDDNSAMETLDAALSRVRFGDVALIKLRNGSSSTTAQTFATTPVINGASVTISLRFNNRPHTITGTTFIVDSTYRIGSGIIINGPRAFQIEGTVSISITGTCLIDTTSETFAVGSGKTAALTLLKQDTAAFTASGRLSNDSSVMSVNFMNASGSSVVPSGGWGAKTKVV